MPEHLPVVEQRITIEVAGWIAALDQVLAATRDLIDSGEEPDS